MQTQRWLVVLAASWGPCAVVAAASPPSSKVVPIRTLHEGEVPYARHDVRTWVRAGPKAEELMASDRRFGEKLLGPFRETDNVRALRTAIGLHLAEKPKAEDVWEGARHILQWLDKHGRHNNGAYEQMMGRDWPSVERIADYYAHPFSFKTAAQSNFKAIPLLQTALPPDAK